MKDRKLLTELIRTSSFPLLPRPSDPFVLENIRQRVAPGPFRPVRAVLFDVYGTLFVSGSGDIGLTADGSLEEADGRRITNLLAPYADKRDLPRLRKYFVEAVRRRHEELRSTHPVPEIRVEKIWADILGLKEDEARDFSLRFELAVNPVYPMPGALAVLESLAGAGVPLGIVSNAQFFTPLLFDAFFGRDLSTLGFHKKLLVYSYEENEAKPSSRLFEKAAEALGGLGIKAQEALYVGNDMLNDILAASRTGFRTGLFAGDKRSLRVRDDDEGCRDLRPDLLVECLDEILHYIER